MEETLVFHQSGEEEMLIAGDTTINDENSVLNSRNEKITIDEYNHSQTTTSRPRLHSSKRKFAAKKAEQDGMMDKTLIQTMKQINETISKCEVDDEGTLFVRSLVPQLKQMDNPTRSLAKMQIQVYYFIWSIHKYKNNNLFLALFCNYILF